MSATWENLAKRHFNKGLPKAPGLTKEYNDAYDELVNAANAQRMLEAVSHEASLR